MLDIRWINACFAVCVLLRALGLDAQTITVVQELTFGEVLPGVPKSVPKTTVGEAAEFHITGTAQAEVSIDFTLPSYLSTSGATMPLVFSTTDCALDSSATPDQTNPPVDNLNPWHTIIYRLGATGLTVWLGGTVVPAMRQKAGAYSATIVATVAYTGN